MQTSAPVSRCSIEGSCLGAIHSSDVLEIGQHNDHRVSLWGVTSGSVVLCAKNRRPACWVFGDALPDLVIAASVCGFNLECVMMRTLQGCKMAKEILPPSVKICSWEQEVRQSMKPTKANVAFCGFRVTIAFLAWLEGMGFSEVVTTRPPRGRLPSWSWRSALISHQDAGGVTDRSFRMHFIYRTEIWRLDNSLKVPKRIGRDASTILEATVRGRGRIAIPKTRVISPLEVVWVRKNTVHGQGLLPATKLESVWVATPCCFVKGSWVTRKLTVKEQLLALDVPSLQIDILDKIVKSLDTLSGWIPALVVSVGFEEYCKCRKLSGTVEGLETSSTGIERTAASKRQGDLLVSPRPPKQVLNDIPAGPRSFVLEEDIPSDPFLNPTAVVAKRIPSVGIAENVEMDEVSEVGSVASQTTGEKALVDEISRVEREKLATKSDDAEIPVYLWREHLVNDGPTPWTEVQQTGLDAAMDMMRSVCLRWWKRKVQRSLFDWLRKYYANDLCGLPERTAKRGPIVEFVEHGYVWTSSGQKVYRNWWGEMMLAYAPSFKPGREALWYASESSWWEWDKGSRPFFWRWPEFYLKTIRDGLEIYLLGPKPTYQVPQPKVRTEEDLELLRKKILKVRERGYIGRLPWGEPLSLLPYFYIPKGTDDIRVVYNGTVCGLNEIIWVPTFALPTVAMHLRSICVGSYMGDVDAGEQFLNYILHDELRKLCGVD